MYKLKEIILFNTPNNINRLWKYPILIKPDIGDLLKQEYYKYINDKSFKFHISKGNNFLRISYKYRKFSDEINMILKWDELINIKRIGLCKFLKNREEDMKRADKYYNHDY